MSDHICSCSRLLGSRPKILYLTGLQNQAYIHMNAKFVKKMYTKALLFSLKTFKKYMFSVVCLAAVNSQYALSQFHFMQPQKFCCMFV